MWDNTLKPLPSRRNCMPSSPQTLPQHHCQGWGMINRRCRTAFTRVAFFKRLHTCAICAVLASLKLVFYLRLQRRVSFLAKQQIFLLTVFPEFLSHKKLSDARRGTRNNVARSSVWLPTLQIALTDVWHKLSSSIHKISATEICIIPSETHRATTLLLDINLNTYSKARRLNVDPIF